MEKSKLEYRSSDFEHEDRVVEGYQIVFNSESEDLGGFYEVIEPTQISMETVNRSDVFQTLNHLRDRILQRRNRGRGSLDISIDEHGLKYRFTLANTQVQNELYEYIQRGELTQSSFAFTTDHDEWVEDKARGLYKRTIKNIDALFDVQQVFTPAYQMSEVGLRGLNEQKTKSEQQKLEAVKQADKEKREKLQKYYSKLRSKISQL